MDMASARAHADPGLKTQSVRGQTQNSPLEWSGGLCWRGGGGGYCACAIEWTRSPVWLA
jgi:hypothetical protein